MNQEWYMDVTIHAGANIKKDVSGGSKNAWIHVSNPTDIRVKLKEDLTFEVDGITYKLSSSRNINKNKLK